MQANKDYQLKLSIIEKENLTDLLNEEIGCPLIAQTSSEYTLLCALKREVQALEINEIIINENDEVCEWVLNEDDLLLLARLISNSELEELGEKIQVELLKTLLK
tara:strand:+ start:132 stop:446 length:315 start_codon:yes stop_codon:yes gene_type:complete